MKNKIANAFEELKRAAAKDLSTAKFQGKVHQAVSESFAYLNTMKIVPLVSKVQGKEYFSFQDVEKRTRPINKWLFSNDIEMVHKNLDLLFRGEGQTLTADAINQTVYSATIAFCGAIDLLNKNDQKTPGTFFEYICAAIFSALFKVKPTTSLDVLNLDLKTKLPTDFIFDLGANKPKFHVPVKTSTRERIIQVWAHQRVLDGVYGAGRFLAVPVVLGENKTDSKTLEVTEICLPTQWRLYQMHIAQLWRVAYLDIPSAYKDLGKMFPPVPVFTLGELISKNGDLTKIVAQYQI